MKNHAPRWQTEGGAEIECGSDKQQPSSRLSAPATSSRHRPTLDEPIIIAEWWKNRGSETIHVRLSPYEGHNIVDVRTWRAGDDGKLKSGKGFACAVKHLPNLVDIFTKANTKAKELGLIEGEETG